MCITHKLSRAFTMSLLDLFAASVNCLASFPAFVRKAPDQLVPLKGSLTHYSISDYWLVAFNHSLVRNASSTTTQTVLLMKGLWGEMRTVHKDVVHSKMLSRHY